MAALGAGVAAFSIGMFLFDAFSFIQVTFLFYIFFGLGAIALRERGEAVRAKPHRATPGVMALGAHPDAAGSTVIGIVCGESERAAVAEFFELLKTPWQFHSPGDETAVFLVTAQAPKIEFDGRAVLAFGSERTWVDDRFGVSTPDRLESGMVDTPGKQAVLPLETGALALGEESGEVLLRLSSGAPAAIRLHGQMNVVRCGYDLFAEVRRLLEVGQSHRHAATPALDIHVELVRRWLVQVEGILIEIPPVRDGHRTWSA